MDATTAGTPLDPLRRADRERRERAEAWLLRSAPDRSTAIMEWSRRGVALLTAGLAWDVVRVPHAVLHPDLDRSTTPDALRARLAEAGVSGPVFCDPYRPFLYLMVPPGTDADWPRDLARSGVECLGGTRHVLNHVGVPSLYRFGPPGTYWLLVPDGTVPRHVDARHLHDVLHACVSRTDPLAP